MKKNVFKLVLAANLLAVAIVLSLLEKYLPGLNLLRMPQGGSILGLPMLPLLMIGILTDWRYGILAGGLYGILNFFLGGAILHWGSIIFDYILAPMCLGFTGFFKNALQKKRYIIISFLIAGFGKYIFHSLGGVIFFAEYAKPNNPWLYSFILYNGPYMLSGTVFSIILGLLIRKRLATFIVDKSL